MRPDLSCIKYVPFNLSRRLYLHHSLTSTPALLCLVSATAIKFSHRKISKWHSAPRSILWTASELPCQASPYLKNLPFARSLLGRTDALPHSYHNEDTACVPVQ